ncbi:serine/threonine-protein kinase ppk35 [Coccidioides immitis H538.4]|uniref:non-specific serine/threonine protein kinase n=1 Tax=Coccidioides immitis H538.4 TaxID=396776 RepID=A0A0J8RUH8_COCIT|nr:serine/threonine-protein kinase ppk35 [Coccidioides immitis H538.4]
MRSQSPLGKQELRPSHIPSLIHSRSNNDLYDPPRTPQHHGFTSPLHTPHGSPSKSRLPPGATDLPSIFDNAMKLAPSSPTKSVFNLSNLSPGKGQISGGENLTTFNESVIHKTTSVQGSPTRRGNQENAPPGGSRLGKEPVPNSNHAALSRQEAYQNNKERRDRRNPAQTRGLTAEELEKLQLPGVKRLANVAQLLLLPSHTFSDFLDHYFDLLSYVHNRQTRQSQFKAAYPPPPLTSQVEYEAALQKYLGRERAHLRKRRTRLRHADFQILTQVGQGGYGQVYLAQKKDTREVCALKVMSKKLLFKLDEIRHILTERDILTAAKSEWLVKLLYAFQDEEKIYLAMEYVPGGDFRTLLNNASVLHNRHARFYIAEMIQCVDALHALGYIHRDLKPENFHDRFDGPREVLKGEEYDFTVDYWSLDCMLFEALAGYTTVAGATVDETWQNLKQWEQVLQEPVYDDPNYFLSRRTWDLITRLVASKERRFKNIREIHMHEYFIDVNFNRLRDMQPPFVPELDSETDAGYFDDFGSESDMGTVNQPLEVTDEPAPEKRFQRTALSAPYSNMRRSPRISL